MYLSPQTSGRLILLVAVVAALAFPVEASAQAERWTSHTSMRKVNDIDVSSTHVWSATQGGVFSYDLSSGEIESYTVVDGLHNVDVRTIAVDEKRDYVWLGYGDGVLDRIHIESRDMASFRDIERATQFASRGINRIVVQGDSVLVATQFGLVVFDPVKSEVRDSYTRLGDNPAATEIFDVLVAPDETGARQFWVATMDGVARAPVNALNLQDPAAWTVERTGFSPDSRVVNTLSFFAGSVFAGTAMDVYRRDAGALFTRLLLTGNTVTNLVATGDQLIGVERFALIVIEGGGGQRLVSVNGYQDPVVVTGSDGAGFWLADAVQGVARIPKLSAATGQIDVQFDVIPEGPYDGLFSDLMVDGEGNLWAGGVSGSGTGIYMRTGAGEWTTYSSVFNAELQGKNTFARLSIDGSGTVWAGSVGGGVASIDKDGEIATYDQTNSSLVPASGQGSYIPVGGVGTDPDGTIWVTTRASSYPLHVRTPEGDWTRFGPYLGQGLTSRSTAYDRIFVDSFDQKWIVVLDENNYQASRGVLVVDTADPTAFDDDVFRFFGENGSAGQGLPSRAVRYVTEDRDGLIWVGTESGPAYFMNPGLITLDASANAIWPQWADRSQGTFMLFGLAINGIAVDPANQVWFATNNGAWLVRLVEGGYEVVEHFTQENSPLFSDEVMSVAVDGPSGEVFFSTSLGLVSFQGEAVTPSRTARDLFIYPNPVHISGNASPEIFIDGLVEETDIRIMTPAGSLVRQLSARGGRMRWDGRDETGSLVSSGVYLVIAVGSDGNGVANGKVAIIR